MTAARIAWTLLVYLALVYGCIRCMRAVARRNEMREPDDQTALRRMRRPHLLVAGRGVWRES